MRISEILQEATTTLQQMYQGNFPDRDEMFWDYVRPSEFGKELTVQKMSAFKLKMMLTSYYQVEDLEELVDMIDDEDRLELLQRYQNDPNLSNRIVVVADDKIIDGNHRALAAALTNRPINFVDLSDLEEQDDDDEEQLNEIQRLMAKDFTGEKLMPTKEKLISLPRKPGLYYFIETAGRQVIIGISNNEDAGESKKKVIGILRLYPGLFPINNTYEVSSITVHPDFRGQGLAKELYRIAMEKMKFTLMTGDSQTPGGRRNWVSLAKIPEVEVIGFMKFTDNDLDENDQVIDKIMRMGGQFLGPDKYDDLYFAFGVTPTAGKTRMKADTAKAFKLYVGQLEYQTAETGMFAQWRGV